MLAGCEGSQYDDEGVRRWREECHLRTVDSMLSEDMSLTTCSSSDAIVVMWVVDGCEVLMECWCWCWWTDGSGRADDGSPEVVVVGVRGFGERGRKVLR